MERLVTVHSPEGLHARPAAELARAASGFASQIQVVSGEQTANARSLLGILKLAVKSGQTIVLRADGPDAEGALETLATLLEQGK